jgi:GxxExxY protein
MQENIHKESFEPLSERENFLAKKVVDIAFKMHSALGPGLLESVYEKCFCYELEKAGIPYLHQQLIPIRYEEMVIENALKIDILVDNLLILELKAQDNFHPVWEAQLLSYLKLTEKRIGYLINFHVPLMKQGFKRFVL